ncbi:cysteine hydrolase [Oleomonas cavernae]|uniref:Cysteine hydrolase n=1 Tax=Oleomonas cavernae TaxID=2320859 RepID=A0A418WDU3_9PROT|nr:cysteine hydrolase family protein [Oleomonas cavernae]RJF88119.1 cysteine hydrolase [Oleomonas cavernae]
MTKPQSLLQLVGAPGHPSPLAQSALVLIDIQREYLDGALPLDKVREAAGEAAKLLELARRNGVPVIHIVHAEADGGPLFNPATRNIDLLAEVAPQGHEPVLRKAFANAFIGTELDAKVKATGRSELIIAGNMTHLCVSATARAAAEQYGYRVTVVADATATRDLPNPLGGVVAAETVRQTALTELADGFAVVVKDTGAWG